MCLYFVLTVQVYGAENKNKHRWEHSGVDGERGF